MSQELDVRVKVLVLRCPAKVHVLASPGGALTLFLIAGPIPTSYRFRTIRQIKKRYG